MDQNQLNKKKLVMIASIAICVLWWICPIDDVFEASLGPFALTDEAMLTLVAIAQVLHCRAAQNAVCMAEKFIDDNVEDEMLASQCKQAAANMIYNPIVKRKAVDDECSRPNDTGTVSCGSDINKTRKPGNMPLQKHKEIANNNLGKLDIFK